MNFESMADTPDWVALREAVREICDRFDDDYWGRLDRTHTFPHEFATAIAAGGWLGIAMPIEAWVTRRSFISNAISARWWPANWPQCRAR